MKRNKRLSDRVDKVLDVFDNKQFAENLKGGGSLPSARSGVKSLYKLAATLTAVIITVSLAFIFLINPAYYRHDYGAGDFSRRSASLSTINNYTDFVDLTLQNYEGNEEVTYSLLEGYDYRNNKLLAYLITFSNSGNFDSLTMYIIKRKDIKLYNFDRSTVNKTHSFGENIEARYREDFETEGDGIYFHTARGEIFTPRETIYFDYSGAGFEQDSNVIPLITSLLAV